jgi:6-pyruvoyl-tetrahydropterin synthase
VERLRLILVILLTLSGWLSHATATGPLKRSCLSIFSQKKHPVLFAASTKVKRPEILYQIKINSDNRFTEKTVSPDALVDLFQMFGFTQNINGDAKLTLEKGTLYLGQQLDDLITIQAKYVFDKPNSKFLLTEFSLVNSKNGHVQTLTKEPLDYTGKELIKTEFNLAYEAQSADARVFDSKSMQILNEAPSEIPAESKLFEMDGDKIISAKSQFPALIAGEAFHKVLKWIKIISHLDHSEINVVDSANSQKWAIAKGQFRRFIDFAKQRLIRQAFGVFIVYYLIEGASSFSQDVAKYMVQIAEKPQQTISVQVTETFSDGKIIMKEKENLKYWEPNKLLKKHSSKAQESK